MVPDFEKSGLISVNPQNGQKGRKGEKMWNSFNILKFSLIFEYYKSLKQSSIRIYQKYIPKYTKIYTKIPHFFIFQNFWSPILKKSGLISVKKSGLISVKKSGLISVIHCIPLFNSWRNIHMPFFNLWKQFHGKVYPPIINDSLI